MDRWKDHLLILDEATKEQNLKAWEKKSTLEKLGKFAKFVWWDLPKAALKRAVFGAPSKKNKWNK